MAGLKFALTIVASGELLLKKTLVFYSKKIGGDRGCTLIRESLIRSRASSGRGSREEVWEEIWSPGRGPEEGAERRSGRRYGYEVRLRGKVKRLC